MLFIHMGLNIHTDGALLLRHLESTNDALCTPLIKDVTVPFTSKDDICHAYTRKVVDEKA